MTIEELLKKHYRIEGQKRSLVWREGLYLVQANWTGAYLYYGDSLDEALKMLIGKK